MYEIDDAASAVRFECETREIINGYKFKNRIWLRDDFVDWVEAAARSRFDVSAIDAVIAIPTTLGHRINRGYNQSALLAESLAKRLDRRFLGRAVARTGHPKRQSSLTEEEREILRRGRNASPHSTAKNASLGEYHKATGFEALMGYLYLTGQMPRMLELIRAGMEGVDAGDDKQ